MNEEVTTTTTSKKSMPAPKAFKPKRKQLLLPGGMIVNETTLQAWELTSRLRAELKRLNELPMLHAQLAKLRRDRRRETLRKKRLTKKHRPMPMILQVPADEVLQAFRNETVANA